MAVMQFLFFQCFKKADQRISRPECKALHHLGFRTRRKSRPARKRKHLPSGWRKVKRPLRAVLRGVRLAGRAGRCEPRTIGFFHPFFPSVAGDVHG
jgi:hypothetical protein